MITLDELDITKCYYLASPFSTPKIPRETKKQRYNTINDIASVLISRYNLILIEPIVMCYEKAKKYNLPQTFDYWATRDKAFIDRCDGGVIVAMMPGWKTSKGVTAEIQHAKFTGKPIYYLDYILMCDFETENNPPYELNILDIDNAR